MKKNVLVITYGYPCVSTPTTFPFLKELVKQWKNQGVNVRVVNPLFGKAYWKCHGKEELGVYHPKYTEYRILKLIPALRPLQKKLRNKSFSKAVERILPKGEDTILYAHFLDAGYIAAKLSKKYGYPAYCAYGESTMWSIRDMDIHDVRNVMNVINGFISVSTENKQELIAAGISTEEKIQVFPNGVDHTLFYPHSKEKCREELGISQDQIVGVFVGHFSERKGSLRVDTAAKDVKDLKMIYIGAGKQAPQRNNILHCGRVLHDSIPQYLSAADFFVLPTIAEGCCNAIIEAMACGLPIISSIGSFNDDILDDSYAIRVDPMSVEEIRKAICTLVENEGLRKSMSVAAEKAAQDLSVEVRAKKILKWMGLN